MKRINGNYIYPQYKTDYNFLCVIKNAYQFCADEYVRALYLGNRLNEKEQNEVSKKLEYFSGIDKNILINKQLRISIMDYLIWFQEKNGFTISPYDTRFTSQYAYSTNKGDGVGDDELMSKLMPKFVKAFHKIEKEVLGIDLNRPYNVINFNVNKYWSYKS